jgi:Leucine-rich repeat (LRR) protein
LYFIHNFQTSLNNIANACSRIHHKIKYKYRIPDALGTELTHLTHLVLRNNMLTDTDFPKTFSGLAGSLKYLNLSGNNLTSIPPPILELTGVPGTVRVTRGEFF